MTDIKLRDLRLWWPAWNKSIPFTLLRKMSCGDGGDSQPDSYLFHFDPEMAEFTCESTKLRMPVAEATLVNLVTGNEILYSSLNLLPDGKVQINKYDNEEGGYSITAYKEEYLVMRGQAYDPND